MSRKIEGSTAIPALGEAAASGNFVQQREASCGIFSDLRGVSQLVIGAVLGVTNIVEEMHRNIAGISPIVGASPLGRARGLSGWIYRYVRGVTQVVGFGLNTTLAQLTPLLSHNGSMPHREAVLAAINGVLGDFLVASDNPLAIPMRLRWQGRPLVLDRQALATDFAHPGSKLLVLVHGLCMNDLEWQREGHSHGASLTQDLGYTSLYLHYNSGQHISTNGREFAAILERLLEEWPVPVSELVIVGHSMGGLVLRSACHYAIQADHAWLRCLKKLICLGTPHHGAPLERAGNRVNILAGISPYTAPFTRLGQIRSVGVKDLRYGNILDEDWERSGSDYAHDSRERASLPEGVQCFVIAATQQKQASDSGKFLLGDGLVPVKSALGQHKNASLTLPIPASRQAVFHGLNHFDLLSSREVYDQMRHWLAEG